LTTTSLAMDVLKAFSESQPSRFGVLRASRGMNFLGSSFNLVCAFGFCSVCRALRSIPPLNAFPSRGTSMRPSLPSFPIFKSSQSLSPSIFRRSTSLYSRRGGKIDFFLVMLVSSSNLGSPPCIAPSLVPSLCSTSIGKDRLFFSPVRLRSPELSFYILPLSVRPCRKRYLSCLFRPLRRALQPNLIFFAKPPGFFFDRHPFCPCGLNSGLASLWTHTSP